MKIIKTIAVIMLLLISAGIYAQKTYIQVDAESGISVFLDNTFKGITSSNIGGLIIENVLPGRHSLKVVKKGFNPQEAQITVKVKEVYTYKVKPFIPELKITQSGNTGQQQIELKVGKLEIQSIPVSINISIPALGISITKSKDKWLAEDVPVGTYSATFKKENKTLSHEIEIKSNMFTHLFVNLIDGEVENSVYSSMTDPRDGQTYKTVDIGNQVWMAENLKYLPNVSPPSDGSKTLPYYYVYDYKGGNVSAAKATAKYKNYGVLYNYVAALKACPKGWHLPSDEEWKTLEMALDMSRSETDKVGWRGTDEGKKLKSTSGWYNNGNGTDEVGFSVLPGGYRGNSGEFYGLGYGGSWWSATADGLTHAWSRRLHYNSGTVGRGSSNEGIDFSVRCVRD